jgi:hypothetical protein
LFDLAHFLLVHIVLMFQLAQMTMTEQEVIWVQKVIGQQHLLLPLRHIYWLLMVSTNYFSMVFVVVVDRLFAVVVVVVEFDFVLLLNVSPLVHSLFLHHHADLPMQPSVAEN